MAFVLSEQFKRHSFPYNSVVVSNFHYTAYYSVSQIETYLLKNMGIYGAGGVIVPFVGIKLIDMLAAPLLAAFGL